MKKSLSGNTWSGSSWDGKSIYTKKTQEEENGKTSVLSTSARDVVEEYITVNQHLAREVEGRLVVEA